MKQDSACAPGNLTLRTISLPFSEIPEQSRLFLDYQRDPRLLSKFYPSAARSHAEIADRIPEVLENYKTDRSTLCEALERVNKFYEAGEKTFENIDLLRQADCVAIVTGQQAGLFTGPLYTLYKALSIVKMTEYLRGRGIKAVPVFWTAGEDHDFQEVSNAFVLDQHGALVEARAATAHFQENLQVGFTRLDSSIESTINKLFSDLPWTEFSGDLNALLKGSWADRCLYGDAFSKMLSRILGTYGIIIFDPVDNTLKELAAPIYKRAVERSGEMVAAMIERDRELADEGYHSQVLVTEDYFPLFLHAENHTRHSLKKTPTGTFRTKSDSLEFTLDDLANMAEIDAYSFSPTVVLRPVVQDYLLPTLCYFGGAAEIAYFAQNSVVYEVMERPVTPILHRQSFTIVERKHARNMKKFDLEFAGLFEGRENVLAGIVEKVLNPKTAGTFDEVEEKIRSELNRLDRELSELDPALVANLATRRRKIIYHIGALRKKFYRSQAQRDEVVHRQIESLFTALYPYKHLQERTLNVVSFLNSYGSYFVDWVYEAIDLDDKGHRIVYL